jgi:hypothetical protein
MPRSAVSRTPARGAAAGTARDRGRAPPTDDALASLIGEYLGRTEVDPDVGWARRASEAWESELCGQRAAEIQRARLQEIDARLTWDPASRGLPPTTVGVLASLVDPDTDRARRALEARELELAGRRAWAASQQRLPTRQQLAAGVARRAEARRARSASPGAEQGPR